MLIERVDGSGAPIQRALDAPRRRSCSSCSRRRARRTFRRPRAAPGSPAPALPPLRFRSSPQPQRTSAGDVARTARQAARSSAVRNVRPPPRRARRSTAARARAARRRRACARRETPSRRSRSSNRCRWMASAIGEIGAGPQREMQIRLLGQRRRPRVDDDQLRAALLRLAQERHHVDAGRGRVDAPER